MYCIYIIVKRIYIMFKDRNISGVKILLAFCFCFALAATSFSAEPTTAEKLETGKRLYTEGNYDKAMDNFVDVLMRGNSQQIAEANEYINLIHFAMGGIEAPKKVKILRKELYEETIRANIEASHNVAEMKEVITELKTQRAERVSTNIRPKA